MADHDQLDALIAAWHQAGRLDGLAALRRHQRDLVNVADTMDRWAAMLIDRGQVDVLIMGLPAMARIVRDAAGAGSDASARSAREKYGRRNVAGMLKEIGILRMAIRAEGTPMIQQAWDAVEEHIDYAYRNGGVA